MFHANCKRCGRPVVWLREGSKRDRIPIDPEPDPHGDLVIIAGRVIPLPDELAEHELPRRYRRHPFACVSTKARGDGGEVCLIR